jgi:hypothetical protein
LTDWGPGPTRGVAISGSNQTSVAFEPVSLSRVHFDSMPGGHPGPQIEVL